MAEKMSGWICQDEYLKTTAYLTDAELGRLVRALTLYHKDGTTSEIGPRETGAYWFIRADIDKAEAGYVKRCRTNTKNRNSTTNDDETRQTSTNDDETRRTATNGDEARRTTTKHDERRRNTTNDDEARRNNTNNNSNYNSNLNYNDNGKEEVRGEATSPSPTASGHLGADLSPEEITQEQDVQDQAEQYVRAYGLPYNARTLDAIASDIRENGADAVKAALDAATDADTKGGISLKFYRSILNGTGGHGRKGRDAPGDMIHHTREEWDRSSSAAIIDLDDE